MCDLCVGVDGGLRVLCLLSYIAMISKHLRSDLYWDGVLCPSAATTYNLSLNKVNLLGMCKNFSKVQANSAQEILMQYVYEFTLQFSQLSTTSN